MYGQNLGELPTGRPLVIAHRGSSGELPEHTVEGYQRAVDQGADVIECDLAVTKDRELVCSHEPMLNGSTDVATKFPDRRKTYSLETRNITDYFTIDFTLAELKTLNKVQSREYRDQSYNGMFKMATFEEYIAVAQAANRTVGIYPETKVPHLFNQYLSQFNTTVEDMLITKLEQHGYNSAKSPCFVQSFDVASLHYLANRTKVRLVYLMETEVTDELLNSMTSYIVGIGPWKQAIVEVDQTTNKIVRTTNFMEKVKRHGYMVHAYTFRNEDQFLAFDYAADPYREYKKFLDLGVDGLFTDFPSTMVDYLAIRKCQENSSNLPKPSTGLIAMSFMALLPCVIRY